MSAVFSSLFKKLEKFEKSKQVSATKEDLIPWLRSALDNDLYPGLMGWVDRRKGEFYMVWIHKRSGRWSEDKLRALIAYAEQRGRLKGKTHTQIKSLLRCAFNSKKGELQKLKEDKENGRIYYKFIGPTAKTGKIANKRRKHKKVTNVEEKRLTKNASRAKNMISVKKNISSNIKTISSPSKEPALPPFETCFGPFKIPPAQENEVYLMPTESTALSPFDNCFSFRSSKSFPPQENEVCFMPTESRTEDTYWQEQNLLISGQDFDHIFRDSCNEFSADPWQPNYMQMFHPNKDLRVLTEFFSDGFLGMSISINQETENYNNVDSPGIDQYAPTVSLKTNFQFHSRDEQLSGTAPKEVHFLSEMDFDDLILRNDVDAEACKKLMQELDISSSIPLYGLHN